MAKHQIGPLQLMVFGFDKPNFEGKIKDEITKLHDKKLMRLVDGLVVHKKQDGSIEAMETSQLSLEAATEYGAIIGGLIGIGSGDERIAEMFADEMAAKFHNRYEFGLDDEDIRDLAEDIPAGSAALFLLVEHLWAIPLRDAVRDADGVLLAQDFLSPELLISLGEKMYAQANS